MRRVCREPGCSVMLSNGKARRRHVNWIHRRLPDVCHLCNNEPFMCTKDLQNHTDRFHSRSALSVVACCPTKSVPNQDIKPTTARQRHRLARRLAQKATRSVETEVTSDLFHVAAETELNNFITRHAQPDKAFLQTSQAAVNRVVTCLQQSPSDELRPCRVIKGGSLGKGTAVKGKSDIDLDVMLGSYTSVLKLHADMDDILQALKARLGASPCIRVVGKTHRCLEVVITENGNNIQADILPAVDLLLKTSPTQVFDQMRQETETMRGFYSPCLAPLQPQLFDGIPTEVKSLIRLVKYWKKEKLQGGEARATGSFERRTKWPASYAFELIVLHRWNQAGKPQCFNMRRALHSVLTSLVNHTQFRVTFPDRMVYSAGYLDLDESLPYIMDPCNPFNNVYVKGAFDWEATAVEARHWLDKPLFGGYTSTTQTW